MTEKPKTRTLLEGDFSPGDESAFEDGDYVVLGEHYCPRGFQYGTDRAIFIVRDVKKGIATIELCAPWKDLDPMNYRVRCSSLVHVDSYRTMPDGRSFTIMPDILFYQEKQEEYDEIVQSIEDVLMESFKKLSSELGMFEDKWTNIEYGRDECNQKVQRESYSASSIAGEAGVKAEEFVKLCKVIKDHYQLKCSGRLSYSEHVQHAVNRLCEKLVEESREKVALRKKHGLELWKERVR